MCEGEERPKLEQHQIVRLFEEEENRFSCRERVSRSTTPAHRQWLCFDCRNSASPMNSGKLFVTSPEKEDRYYTTRGSIGLDDNGKVLGLDYPGHARDDKGGHVWPRLFLSLSSKEKEEDFMAMKGCKLPQRPKKRAKLLQKSLLLVMPGVWLSDLCQERYEVREKKASKKRPRGLKAMGSMDSDSD
ncbi:unnamed protein product [Prunus armeniaca]